MVWASESRCLRWPVPFCRRDSFFLSCTSVCESRIPSVTDCQPWLRTAAFFVFLPLPMVWLAQWLAAHDDTSLRTYIDKHWWWAPKSWFPCLAWTEGYIGSAKCQCHCHSATCSSVVIAVYVGATGKDVPERKNALLGGRAPKKGPLLGGRALPTLYCFGHILRTFLHRFTTIGVGMGWLNWTLYVIQLDVMDISGQIPRNIAKSPISTFLFTTYIN